MIFNLGTECILYDTAVDMAAHGDRGRWDDAVPELSWLPFIPPRIDLLEM